MCGCTLVCVGMTWIFWWVFVAGGWGMVQFSYLGILMNIYGAF
jgi:hypothetical protein